MKFLVRGKYINIEIFIQNHVAFLVYLSLIASLKMFLFFNVPNVNESEISMRVNRRRLRDSSNVFELPNNEFQQNFRINKEVFKYILDEIKPKMQRRYRSTSVPEMITVATFLRFLATGSYQKSVGNEMTACVSQSKASNIINECIEIFEAHICPDWINLEMSLEEESKVKEDFYSKFNVPRIVGCVDGTHVRIKCPSSETKHLYYNRKGFYSINAMMICDANVIVRYVDARHPGANHDSFIWRMSIANEYNNRLYQAGRRNFWLIGDSGYQLQPYLMTPYRTPADACEIHYNERFRKTRNVIERGFGVLKNRFRCILGERGLHYLPDKATKIINVCCAIHNLCLFYKDNLQLNEENASEILNFRTTKKILYAMKLLKLGDAWLKVYYLE